MKDSIQSVDIVPETAYLEFIGPAKANSSGSSASRTLKGQVRLTLIRSIKLRSLVLKFKGYMRVSVRQTARGSPFEVEVTLLPKVKLDLLSTVQQKKLGPGEHTLPWELNIPNVYPRSLMVKRASIHYKLELTSTSSATGLPKKSLLAEYPVVILRHLLPAKEISPMVGTRIYRHTIPGRFHYEIDCPRIVCLEQKKMPVAIRFLCIAMQKPVLSIKTQILQVELYRCENIPKSDTNLENLENSALANSNVFGQRFADAMKNNPRCLKFTRRKGSKFVHSVTGNDVVPWQRPVLLYHELDEMLTFGLESPLVTIYHQLEITFQFGHKFENICAKVPVMVSSLPFLGDHSINSSISNTSQPDTTGTLPRYKTETAPHYPLSIVAIANEDGTEERPMDPDIAKQQSIFMGLQANSAGINRVSFRPSSSMVLDYSPPVHDSTASPPSPSLSAFGQTVSELDLNAGLGAAASRSTGNNNTNRTGLVARFRKEPLPPCPGSIASSEVLPEMDRRGERPMTMPSLLPPLPQINWIDPWLTNILTREYRNDVGGDDDSDKDTTSDEASNVSVLSLNSTTSGAEDLLRSQPPSPIAPGLPPAIPLQPLPQSSRLVEECFGGCVLSPISSSARSVHSSSTIASSSVLPSSKPSVDSYSSSVQAHYHQAALPPLPPLSSSPTDAADDQRDFEDSDKDDDGSGNDDDAPVLPQLPRLSLGSVFQAPLDLK